MMTPLQRTAIHEAGHAVVAIALGQRVEMAHVRRSLACNGVCILDYGTPPPAADEAAILAAGDLGVRMVEAGWPEPNAPAGAWYFDQMATAPSDRERAAAAAVPSPAAGTGDRAKLARTGVSVRNAEAWAGELLRRHWPAVRAIADRLIQSGELEGDQVHAIARARGVTAHRKPQPGAGGPTPTRSRPPRQEATPAGWYRVVTVR